MPQSHSHHELLASFVALFSHRGSCLSCAIHKCHYLQHFCCQLFLSRQQQHSCLLSLQLKPARGTSAAQCSLCSTLKLLSPVSTVVVQKIRKLGPSEARSAIPAVHKVSIIPFVSPNAEDLWAGVRGRLANQITLIHWSICLRSPGGSRVCSRGALSPDHNWKNKQKLWLNGWICLGQPAVQWM